MIVVYRSQKLHLKKKSQFKELKNFSNLYIVGKEKESLMETIESFIKRKK